MNNDKSESGINYRQVIEKTLVEYFKKHGAQERNAYFKPAINSLKLSKEELADRASDGVYTKRRALIGSIINELVKKGTIKLKENDDKKIAEKVETKKKDDVKQSDNITTRRKMIIKLLSERYLTEEECKDTRTCDSKFNLLSNYVKNENQKENIKNKSFDDAVSYVEKWFLGTVNIKSNNEEREKKYPDTDIGKCLKNQNLIYRRFCNKDISEEEYNNTLDKAIVNAIRILGGPWFEKLCLDLLKKVYEKRLVLESDAVIGGTNDHGIDGRFKICDELGIEEDVCFQSKLSEHGEKSIREFIGAIAVENYSKGVFISLSPIEAQAKKYLSEKKRAHLVTLIGKNELLPLMRKHFVGVIKDSKTNILKIDDVYFNPNN